MKQYIKKVIKKLIPNIIKNRIINIIRTIATEQVDVHLDILYQKIASLEKVEYKLNAMEQLIKRREQRFTRLEKLEYKLRYSYEDNNIENSNEDITTNVLSDYEYDKLEKQICRGRKIVEKDYFDSLSESFPINSRILDLGCGDGAFLNYMNKKGFFAEGIDANTEYQNEENIILGYIPESLNKLPSNYYDIVASFHLIEHLPLDKYKKMVKETYRVLKVGGKIFFETPNTQSLITMSQYYYKDPTHLMPRHPEVYANILRFNGFKNIEIKNLPELDQKPFSLALDKNSELHDKSIDILNEKFFKIENILQAGSGNVLIIGIKQ